MTRWKAFIKLFEDLSIINYIFYAILLIMLATGLLINNGKPNIVIYILLGIGMLIILIAILMMIYEISRFIIEFCILKYNLYRKYRNEVK